MRITGVNTIIILSVAALSFVCCPQKATAQKWMKISKKDYTIKSPVDWSVDSSKQMGTDLVMFSMFENGTDKFRENVNVVIQNVAGRNLDLEKFTALSTNQIKTMAADSKIEESKTIKTGSSTYQKMIYSATQAGSKLKFEQYYFVVNNKAYVITLTAEIAKFEIFRPVGEEILNSFVLR